MKMIVRVEQMYIGIPKDSLDHQISSLVVRIHLLGFMCSRSDERILVFKDLNDSFDLINGYNDEKVNGNIAIVSNIGWIQLHQFGT